MKVVYKLINKNYKIDNFFKLNYNNMIKQNFCSYNINEMILKNKTNMNYYLDNENLISFFNQTSFKINSGEIQKIKIKKEREINNTMLINLINIEELNSLRETSFFKPECNIGINKINDKDIDGNKSIVNINSIEFKARNNRIPKQVRFNWFKANHGARPCSSVMRRLKMKDYFNTGRRRNKDDDNNKGNLEPEDSYTQHEQPDEATTTTPTTNTPPK